MNFSYLLQFAIASSRSHSHKAGFIALDYEATALGKVQNLAEPLQTLFFTPAAVNRESRFLYKLTFEAELSINAHELQRENSNIR